MNWQNISASISAATGQAFNIVKTTPVNGGDINSAYKLQGGNANFFVKLNRAGLADMFAAEQAGLTELATTKTLKVPQPIVSGITGHYAFLVLEYIDLGGNTKQAETELGQQLAMLHKHNQPYFGWHRDNTIGSTPQSNHPCPNWGDFWRDRRLGKQLQLAAKNGYTGHIQSLGDRLLADMDLFFRHHQPQPSLLHGDLWGGNWAASVSGVPVIFDPACYYGDRETDLAMTGLFGGFSASFYAAYQATWPLAEGYKDRKPLYNLYHILNHLNLFGGGYLKQAENTMLKLLSAIG